MSAVTIPAAHAGRYRDGGIADYHLDLDFGGQGLVLYPHFYPRVIPGWFDRSLPWRRARSRSLARTLLLVPSADFVARLPHGRIPDRGDFARMRDAERMKSWRRILELGRRLGDELGELLASGRVLERVRPLP